MDKESFLPKLAKIIQVDEGSINDETPLNNEILDSFAILEVMALVDQELGVIIAGTDLSACKKVGDIFKLLPIIEN